MKISKQRWEVAQKYEKSEWNAHSNVETEEWEENVRKYSKYFEKLEKKLKVTKSWRILDIGCNSTCVSRLIKLGKHLGVDPLANDFDMDNKVPEVKIFQGMGEDMGFIESDSINLIICRNVIDHSFNPSQVINEVRRVLKKDGYFMLAGYVYNPFIWFIKTIGERLVFLRNVG
ncbi:class I SAM-dependent methyltransferase, partial [Patescibacteria group bacterium]|nr:class I SAM-dependent methyltransferase [Patescibacteria group bacterium]